MIDSFSARIRLGADGQAELAERLHAEGFQVFETGQENWLSRVVHAALRFEHADQMVRAVRYFPDLLAWRADWPLAYWEAKTNATPGTPNFSIEKACYEEMMARHAKGERVVVAFRDTDGMWRANWIERLEIRRDMTADRQVARGSHTPYLLLPKSCTRPWEIFLRLRG